MSGLVSQITSKAMTRALAGLVLVLVVTGIVAAPAQAHRLDEYLQATTIAVTVRDVTVDIRLTPGVSVANRLIEAIDRNHDGAFSLPEEAAYADRVRHDVSLTLDGHVAPLHLLAAAFPSQADIRSGTGDIVLHFAAPLPDNAPRHHLVFSDRHYKAFSVYLVNALIPRDPSLRLGAQVRNIDQSAYALDFGTGIAAPAASGKTAPPAGPSITSLLMTFFWHGVVHILTGYDHLLFGLALVLGADSLLDLLAVITVFTIAHSLTLTLAALGLVNLPSAIVEPIISASIVFVALQNIIRPGTARGPVRLGVAFLFGLFHGLGFAGGLLEIMHHMPTGTILVAIVGFSVGIEAGNQLVLLPAFAALSVVRRHSREEAKPVLKWIRVIGSAAISVAGMFFLGSALTSA